MGSQLAKTVLSIDRKAPGAIVVLKQPTLNFILGSSNDWEVGASVSQPWQRFPVAADQRRLLLSSPTFELPLRLEGLPQRRKLLRIHDSNRSSACCPYRTYSLLVLSDSAFKIGR